MSTKIQYHQRSRTKGSKQPQNTKCCDRRTKWGNRHQVGRSFMFKGVLSICPYTVEQALELYQLDLIRSITSGKLDFTELIGFDYLSCWCKVGEPCHVQDVLIPCATQWRTIVRIFQWTEKGSVNE